MPAEKSTPQRTDGVIGVGNAPAFPTSVAIDAFGGVNTGAPGMTLRDWFAGQALLSIQAGYGAFPDARLAAAAYTLADAMLAERAK